MNDRNPPIVASMEDHIKACKLTPASKFDSILDSILLARKSPIEATEGSESSRGTSSPIKIVKAF